MENKNSYNDVYNLNDNLKLEKSLHQRLQYDISYDDINTGAHYIFIYENTALSAITKNDDLYKTTISRDEAMDIVNKYKLFLVPPGGRAK